MPKYNYRHCLYRNRNGLCGHTLDEFATKICKRKCEFFTTYTCQPIYPNNTYNDLGFNGMKESDY